MEPRKKHGKNVRPEWKLSILIKRIQNRTRQRHSSVSIHRLNSLLNAALSSKPKPIPPLPLELSNARTPAGKTVWPSSKESSSPQVALSPGVNMSIIYTTLARSQVDLVTNTETVATYICYQSKMILSHMNPCQVVFLVN